MDEGAEQPAQRGAGEPVEMIQKRHEEHKPPLIHIPRNISRIVDGKAFVTHPEDEIEGFPSISAVFFQHGDTVKQMPGVDHKSHGERLKGAERSEQEIHCDELHTAGKDSNTHQHRIDK